MARRRRILQSGHCAAMTDVAVAVAMEIGGKRKEEQKRLTDW